MASNPPAKNVEKGSIGDVIETVKAYAEQETVGPIKGVGKWVAAGAAGAVVLGIGSLLVILGVLRLLQTEISTGRGWSVLWYAIALLLACGLGALAVSRINKTYLDKKDQ